MVSNIDTAKRALALKSLELCRRREQCPGSDVREPIVSVICCTWLSVSHVTTKIAVLAVWLVHGAVGHLLVSRHVHTCECACICKHVLMSVCCDVPLLLASVVHALWTRARARVPLSMDCSGWGGRQLPARGRPGSAQSSC